MDAPGGVRGARPPPGGAEAQTQRAVEAGRRDPHRRARGPPRAAAAPVFRFDVTTAGHYPDFQNATFHFVVLNST